MEKEIFKDIPGYEGLYQVSNKGRVKHIKDGKDNVKKLNISTTGYYRVNLWKDNKYKTRKVHQLVAMAFLGHKPNGYKLIIDHINNDKLDNRVENLQLTTNRYNTFKDRKNGTSKYAGVSFDGKKFTTAIQIKGDDLYLGRYESEKKASLAYKIAVAREHRYNCNQKEFREYIKKLVLTNQQTHL